MELSEILRVFEAIAPLELAASWDNVGLLIEGRRQIRRLFCTIDLTEPVLAEALEDGADLIVSYHPPIFGSLKRLTSRSPAQRLLLDAIRAGVHVYSPHTALDAAPGGMTDWLLEGVGATADVRPIEPVITHPAAGSGRTARLLEPVALDALLPRLKAHLGLQALRVAAPDPAERIGTVAVCPGAGGSVFERVGPVGLLLTGEMRHHDVLARIATGTAVILTDHTNTERGYLPRLAQRLTTLTGLHATVSAIDRDPLQVR